MGLRPLYYVRVASFLGWGEPGNKINVSAQVGFIQWRRNNSLAWPHHVPRETIGTTGDYATGLVGKSITLVFAQKAKV